MGSGSLLEPGVLEPPKAGSAFAARGVGDGVPGALLLLLLLLDSASRGVEGAVVVPCDCTGELQRDLRFRVGDEFSDPDATSSILKHLPRPEPIQISIDLQLRKHKGQGPNCEQL